jgi:ABC-type antimicrobial peptide transport system permease subunit
MMAVLALRRNVTRSALTILGIVIGIAAVIAMMEIGNGSSGAIAKTIASMGANNLLLMPGQAASGGVSFGAGSTMTLTAEDCAAILRDCDAVSGAAPVVRARSQIVYQDRNWVPQFIYGTTQDYLVVREWSELAEGESFGEAEVRNGARVCLIGKTIVREIFQGQSPIGKELRIRNVSLKVIGVMTPKGANTFGMDQDDIVIAPWTTIKYRVTSSSSTSSSSSDTAARSSSTSGSDSVFPGAASVYPPASTQAGQTPIVRFANIDHRIRPGEPEDFQLRDMTESADAMAKTTKLMTNLLLFVALISLVVGGVGIMNIMLVSVTERTKEIGLRMAVGARGKDILTQFLAEAVLLCIIGGVVGLALGRGSSMLVQRLLKWPVEPSIAAIIASVAVSAIVGIVFGFYPAWKASRMDPIEALRYE